MDAPVAATGLADLQGVRDEQVEVFRGMRYVAPPVGPLRFAPPASAARWTGLRQATAHGPITAISSACGVAIAAATWDGRGENQGWMPAAEPCRCLVLPR